MESQVLVLAVTLISLLVGVLVTLWITKGQGNSDFCNIVTNIMRGETDRLNFENQDKLNQLLEPLKTQLKEFKEKVEKVYVDESKDRSALADHVQRLVGLNQALSDDAKKLTEALRGSSKIRGNWGELILERVLESSGLRKGDEYKSQGRYQREEEFSGQPDVVIYLPEGRHIVIDSKISLIAYQAAIAAEDNAEREKAIANHVDSMRRHIKGLSEQNYHSLYGLKSMDFVVMFVPIEPAFMLAVGHDQDILMHAWSKGVLLASPSTLLFVLRTVAHLWGQERQARHHQQIAARGAEFYDRLSAFVDDVLQIGRCLDGAQNAFVSAKKRLSEGKGNVIRQAEMLKDFGVKPTKPLSRVQRLG
jgi:DNA recombination protein RmuC